MNACLRLWLWPAAKYMPRSPPAAQTARLHNQSGMKGEAQRRAVWCELVSDQARGIGEVRLKAGGGSMLPVLWPGDLVTVQRCDFAGLEPGQIVLHSKNEILTLHRIARIAADHLITRGDSLPRHDPPVMPSEILGQVVSISRGGRTIDPRQTLWQRVVASILRHSRFLRRVTVYLSRRLRRSADLQAPPRIASPLPAAKQ